MKSFNVNSIVKVKLTEYGKELYKKRHIDFFGPPDGPDRFPYNPPEEDADGYSQFKFWDLMNRFSYYVGIGYKLPFDPDILIDEMDLKDD